MIMIIIIIIWKVNFLLKEETNPIIKVCVGWTSLHEACNYGFENIANFLENAAFVDVPNK